jgi:hypothetical protein
MMYKYEISGLAAEGQTWKTSGMVETQKPGEFMTTPDLAMSDAFFQLTQGKAVFGKPGLGCKGPYRVLRMMIEELKPS